MDESKAIELYDFLVKEGYDVNTKEVFIDALKNTDKASELYDFFSKEGYDLGEKKNFSLSEDSVSANGTLVTSDSAYGGTIQDFAESEEIQQMPTYEEQGQDLSPGLKEMSTSNVDFEEETVEQKTVEQKTVEEDEPAFPFSWDAGAQPTTVTATEEVQTVASDPDVGVESKQTMFVKKYYPIIQKEIEKAGLDIDAGALTTQLALESGWGSSSLASEHNNFGGYKSTKDGLKTAPLETREYFTDKEKEKWEKDPENTIIEATGKVKGNKKEYKVKTPFKAFATPEEGIAAQIKLISKERYAKHGTTKSGGDAKKYFDAVAAGGYATSPTYAQKNLSLYNSEILPILEDKFKYIADKEERDQFKILEERLQQIDLTGETEETIVPALNSLLGEYGFKFEQAAIGSDAVKITSSKLDRDGNLIEKVVNFDSLINKLEGGIEDPSERDSYEKEIADFVKENRDISIRIEQDKKKIINEKELKQVTEDFNIEAKEYEQLVKQLNQEAAVLTKEADTYKKGVPGYEDYLKRKKEYDVKTKDLLSLKENLVTKGKEYDSMVGEYHIMRREGGNFFGQMYDQLKSSVGGGTSYIANILMHQLAVSNPAMFAQLGTKEFKYGKEEKYVNPFSDTATDISRDTDEGKVEFIKDLPFKILGRSSTKEYLEDYQQAPLFSAKGVGNVWFSVLEFLPAAKAKLLGTIALSANYVLEEMQDSPKFDDVSEGEKLGVSAVIGSVVGALEKIGFSNVMQSKAFTQLSTSIASKVMLRNPATRRTFNEYVEQEVNSLMAKGALKMLAGGTAEFETGATQEAAEMGLKYVYNQMKGSDLFETPEDWREAAYEIFMGGVAEGMGGMMMATPKTMSYAFGTDDLSEVDDKTFKMFKEMSKDSKYLDFVTTKLQQQVVNQEITKDEMKKILTDYNRLNGAMQKMPDGIDQKYQKRLLGLFMQHQKLKDNMKNTDDVFNKEDKKKLAQIENRIDAVLKENKVEKEVDEVLNTTAEESKVFYAENLEDIPEQHRDKAEKVEDDDTEISFRTNRFGLPIGKVKSTKVGEYYKYTLDGAEIEQTIEENTEEVVEEAQEETKGASNLKSAGQAAAKKWNIEKRKKGKKDPEERTVGNAIGAKVTMNGERGVIKEDPLNPNTIIFESLELEEDISPLQKEVETLSKTVEDIEEGALKQRIQGQLDSKKEELDRRKKRKRKIIEIGNIQEVMLKPLSEFEIKEDREISGRFFSSEEGDFKVVKQSKGKKGELFIVLEDMNFQKKKDSVNERLRKGEITKKEALNEIKELEKNKTKKYTGDKAVDILKKSRERGKKQDPYGYFRDKTPRGTARTVPEKVSVIMGDSTVPKEKYKQYERIVDMAIKAMNALSKALPNVRILLHANSDTFTEETKKKNVRGLFDPRTNIIHINLPKANLRTVGHEVLHAILVNRLKTDKKVGAVVDEMITSIKKAVNPKVAKELEAFTKRYKGAIKNEEYIAELFGILSERANSLSPKAKNIIAEFIQKLRELFNLPSEASVSDQEVVDFLNTLALRVGQGQVIEEEALSLLEDVDKKVTATKRKQIVGENAELVENVRENLSVARQMEEDGKSEKEIRIATGWERGKDTKWRYEIPDATLSKKGINNLLKGAFVKGEKRTYKITDILNAPELFEAYPNLKNIPIVIARDEDMDGALASYTAPPFNIITLSESLINRTTEEQLSTILHELQHAVQEKEGFSAGGNLETALKKGEETYETLEEKLNILEEVKRLLNTESYFESEENIEPFTQDPDYIINDTRQIKGLPLSNQAIEIYLQYRDDYKDKGSDGLYEAQEKHDSNYKEVFNKWRKIPSRYKRIAGEVEARNVQRRMKMTPEERRETTLQETEDVAREDQIIFFAEKEDTPTIREQKGDNIQEFINELNSQGYTNSEIKQFLIDEMGYTKAEAEALFPKTKTPPVTKKKTKKKTKKDTAQSLIQMINELDKKSKGVVSKAKTKSLIKEAYKVAKLNNQKAEEEFVERVRQVYEKSSNVQERKEAVTNRKNAKRKLPKQFGVEVRALMDAVQKILSVDVALLPDSLLEEYNSIIGEFAKRVKIQVFGEDNFVQEYTPKVGALLGKIEKILQNQVEEEVTKEKKDAKEDTDERKQNIKEILEKKKTNNTLKNEDEKNLAAVLLSVTKKDLKEMTNEQLRDLNALLSQIQRGYISTFYATKMRTVIEGNVRSGYTMRAKVNMKRAGKYFVNGMGRVFANFKSKLTKKVPLLELIRSTMTSDIDTILGNFNHKDIYHSTFGKLSKAYQQYTSAIDEITNKLDKVNQLIAKKGKVFKKMNNEQLLSRYRIMASLLQDEFLANSIVKKDSKGNDVITSPKGVASALDYINGTIEKLEDGDVNDKAKAEILEKLKKEIEKNGINLSKNEQEAKKIIQEINNELTEKFMFVAASRGESPTIYNSYIHHSAFYTKEAQEDMIKQQQKVFSTPSTKPGTKEERSDNKAISFDPAFSTLIGAKQTLLDYHMRQPIAEVRAGINTLKGSKKFGQRDAAIQLDKAFTESLDIVISQNLSYTGLGVKIMNKIRTLSYYSLLASIPRAFAELGSNLSYVIFSSPVNFTSGVKNFSYLCMGKEGSAMGAGLMNAVGSEVTSKNYSREALSGSKADAGTLKKSSFDVKNPMGKTWQFVTSVYENTLLLPGLGKTANYIAEKLIATPDKALARPLWFGTFFSELQSLTGKKFSKKQISEMAEGKSELLTTYKKEIEQARKKADGVNTRMSTSANPFNTRLKDQVRNAGSKKDANGFKNTWRVVNTYMASFAKNEYNTVRTGVIALIHSGEISRGEGAALIVAATTRMTGYMVLYTLFRNMFYPLLQSTINAIFGFDDDEEEEKDVDYLALTKRQLTGSIAQLMTKRALGNVPYIPIGLTTEWANKEYLSSLRNDEPYDPFENSIVYSTISMNDLATKDPLELALGVGGGPIGPLAQSAIRGGKILQRIATSKTEKARERAKRELYSRTIIEMAGNLGLVPFYKDIRKMIMKGLYESEYKTKGKGIDLTKAQKKKYLPELYKIEQEMERLEKQSPAYKMKQKMKADQKKMKEQMLKLMYK